MINKDIMVISTKLIFFVRMLEWGKLEGPQVCQKMSKSGQLVLIFITAFSRIYLD